MRLGIVALALLLGVTGAGDRNEGTGDRSEPRTFGTRDLPAVQATEGYVTADDGTRLYYRVVGDGSQTVVIPVGVYLEPLLERLASPERRLVFYDPRGRGRSDAVDPGRVSLDHQVRDLEAVRLALGIERMALLGWSGVGMEAAVYAMRHPQRVTRLVQVGPVPPRQTPWAEQGYATRTSRYDSVAVRRYTERRDAGGFEDDPAGQCRALNAFLLPALLADPSRLDRIPDVCVHENEWPVNTGPLFEALLGSFGDYDWREELESLRVPRLVIHGEDEAFPLEGSREWVRGYPEARLLVVPAARHLTFVDRPDVFFPAMERFLAGEWPEGARRVPVSPADTVPGWELLWADEFEGERIDRASWTPEVMPDPHNEELQYYTDRVDGEPDANAWVEDGSLVLEARREDFEHRRYTSARLITKGKREFRYGRFEARIRRPGEVGMWPAFWLLGGDIDEVGWPRCGEIDIMEGKGRLPDWTSGALHRGPDPTANRVTVAEYRLASGSFHDAWHVFAVEWSPGRIRWYVDGVAFQTVEKTPGEDDAYWPFDEGRSFFIILNLAVGGWFDAPHSPPRDMEPQRLHVDYVRVYRRTAAAG